MNTKELRLKTMSELKDLLLQNKKEAMNLRFQRVNGQLQAPARIRTVRRTVARIKTLLGQQSSTNAGAK